MDDVEREQAKVREQREREFGEHIDRLLEDWKAGRFTVILRHLTYPGWDDESRQKVSRHAAAIAVPGWQPHRDDLLSAAAIESGGLGPIGKLDWMMGVLEQAIQKTYGRSLVSAGYAAHGAPSLAVGLGIRGNGGLAAELQP